MFKSRIVHTVKALVSSTEYDSESELLLGVYEDATLAVNSYTNASREVFPHTYTVVDDGVEHVLHYETVTVTSADGQWHCEFNQTNQTCVFGLESVSLITEVADDDR